MDGVLNLEVEDAVEEGEYVGFGWTAPSSRRRAARPRFGSEASVVIADTVSIHASH